MVTEKIALIPKLIQVVSKANNAILEIYHQSQACKVHTKSDNSPVTKADMISHALLVKGVAELTPDIPILSEEAIMPLAERKQWKKYWCIDPLDGTQEFISRNGEFCINVSLIENHQPVLGLIYIPVKNTCYYAVRGNGAFRQIDHCEPESIHVRPWSLKKTIIAASRGTKLEDAKQFFANLKEYEIIRAGSARKR